MPARPCPVWDGAVDVPLDPAGKRRLVLIAGLFLLGAAAASWAPFSDTVHGLTARYWDNIHFAGTPSRVTREREPFVRSGHPAPFSAEWSGTFYVVNPGLYRFRIESDDDGEVDVDGRTVVADPGEHWARGREGRVALGAGAHAFRVRYVQRGGGAYLRVVYHDDSGPQGAGVVPLPWEQLFPKGFVATSASVEAARRLYDRARLLAGIALLCFVLALLLAWIHWRRRRGLGPAAPGDLLVAFGIFAVGWAARGIGLTAQGRTWDERDYFAAGEHYVRNVLLGDFAHQAFHYNLEHPPIAKWIYAIFTALLAVNDDDHAPGKLAASLMGAAVCVLVYLIVRELYDEKRGVLAGILCAFVPHLVAHGKVLGLEAPMTLFYVAAIYGIVRWVGDQSRVEPLVWAGLCTGLAIFSRMTAVWVIPTLLVPFVGILVRGPPGSRGEKARALLPYLAGLIVSVVAVYAVWPWVWGSFMAQIRQTGAHWTYRVTEWYLGRVQPPPASYYTVAFLISSPAGYLAATAAWAVFAARRRRLPDAILAGFLLFPFLQTISDFRQDQVRYVIQAFVALSATAAVGCFDLSDWLAARFPKLGRPRLAVVLPALLALYAVATWAWIYPYYLDYYNEILGGPAGVERRRTMELSWWGEGIVPLVEWMNATLPPGARIYPELYPGFDVPRFRGDLRAVWSPAQADYIVANDFGFAHEAGPGPGWEVVHAERAGNQDIGWVWKRVGLPAQAAREP